MKRVILMSVCLVLAASSAAFARGMLVPTDGSLPPLAILSHRVNVTIDSQLATTKVEQVFQNNTNRALEATYIFPLPPGATITDFAMVINGERKSGELVEKDKARAVYQEIVRRLKDPGILEYMGGNLFKINIFPIPAGSKQRLEIQYTEVLARDSGMCKYVYPLKTDEPAGRTMEDFTVGITIRSKEPITNIYSPSHQFGISRKGDFEAVIGLEHDKALLDRDVLLYYTVSDKAFGTSILSHKPFADKDGYFLLLVTPKTQVDEKDILPRDVCFVLDTSGSMASDRKLEKAKAALKYCVSSLREKDRFTVIAFATASDPLSRQLLPADAAGRDQANKFIDRQEAVGGTAIFQALADAVAMAPKEGDRPYTVVFLTDGRPTVGEDRDDEILKVVQSHPNIRVFTWGVGSDVNTKLLDLLAQKTRAIGEYVAGNEDIEQKVSLFFNKMAKPVLANATIDWGKLKVHDVYPREIGDLFAGQQVTVFGRYEGSGDAALALQGTINGNKATQVFEGTFGKDPGNPFVEKMWAARHVGFLLDEVRLRGEKPELKDEIIRLSRAYGIQTPYTSYLVLETKEDYAKHGLGYIRGNMASGAGEVTHGGGGSLGVGEAGGAGDHLAGKNTPMRSQTPADYDDLRKRMELERAKRMDADRPTPGYNNTEPGAPDWITSGGHMTGKDAEKAGLDELREVTGDTAVKVAKAVGDLKRSDSDPTAKSKGASLVRRVGERTLYWYAGFYVDGDFTDKLPTLRVKYLSDAYFQLVDKIPSLKDVLALGDRIIVVVNGTALVIDDGGSDKLTDADWTKLGVK